MSCQTAWTGTQSYVSECRTNKVHRLAASVWSQHLLGVICRASHQTMSNRKSIVISLSAFFIIFPLPFVAARFYARRIKRVTLGIDDILILISLLFVIGLCTSTWVSASLGNLGEHETLNAQGLPVADSAYLVESQVSTVPDFRECMVISSWRSRASMRGRFWPRSRTRWLKYPYYCYTDVYSAASLFKSSTTST